MDYDDKAVKALKDHLKSGTPIGRLRSENNFVNLAYYILAGYKATDLKKAGFDLDQNAFDFFSALGDRKRLIAAGFNQLDFHRIGIETDRLRDDGLKCEDLLQVGWDVESLRESYGADGVKSALKAICAKKSVHTWKLKAAGFSISDMKEAGYNAPDLTIQGSWDSDEEKEEVEHIYGEEEIWRQLEQFEKTESAPFPMDLLGKGRNYYLEAARKLMQNRDDRRRLEKINKDLEKRIKDANEWRDDLRQKFNAIRELEANKQRVEELRKQREEDEENVKSKRKALLDVVDKRIDHLNRQIEFQKKKSKAIRSSIKKKLERLNHPFGEISCFNHDLVRGYYPLEHWDTATRKRLITLAETKLGVPENVDFAGLKHPVEELVPSERNPKKLVWVSSEGSQYQGKPLEYLQFLEAKMEKAEWIINDHEAEIELLENVKEAVKNKKALWRPIASKAVFHTLLGLARYTTTEVGMPSLLPTKVSDLSPIKWRRITGKIDFNLELGVSAGVGSMTAATATVGIKIALSGSLAVEDDRRVRARISLKLIPNLEVKVHPGTFSVAKATASFGFTITSQAMAFVDEKHFAHYIMFRIANIRNFQDKLMQYGARGMDCEHDPYSETIKQITSQGLNRESVEKYYEEQRIYLTEKPVVKAYMPISGKVRPTVDLGAESSVIGLSTAVSAQMPTPMIFNKELLALPDTKSKRAEALPEFDGAEYWEYKANLDGDCAYNSLRLVLHHAEITSKYLSVSDLRKQAANYIKLLYSSGQDRGHPLWNIDTELYTDVSDYVDSIKKGKVDKSGRHKHWADLQVLAALAEIHQCRIQVHQLNQDAVILPPNPTPDTPMVHLAYRNRNQFNALIEKDVDIFPIDQADLPEGFDKGIEPQTVQFNEKGIVTADSKIPTWRLDKRKPRPASEIAAVKKDLKRKYTPRLITYTRKGNSMSLGGSVDFSSWINIGLEGSLIRINQHINPDNDGDYLNVKTKANLLQRTFAAEPTSPPEPGDDMGRDALGKIWAKSEPPKNLGLDKLANALGPVELKTNFMSRYIEWNYVKEGPWYHKQYRRYCYTSGMSIGISGDVDVYPGFVAGLSFSFGFSKSVTMSESLGTNTLSYIITVLNGLKLRPTGKKQWDAFLKKHRPTIRLLYLLIGSGKAKDNPDQAKIARIKDSDHWRQKHISKVEKKNDKKLDNAYKVARQYEALVLDNKHVWENAKGKDTWCEITAEDCEFIDTCHSNISALKASRRQRIAGSIRAKYNPVPACMDDLDKRFTTLLWRVSLVLSLYDARMHPFKRKVRYLIPAIGHISFKTKLISGTLQSLQAPQIKVPSKESKAVWVKYQSAADIWLNKELRNASSALEFYRAGFQIDLQIKLRHSTLTVPLQPVGSIAADTDKDNKQLLQDCFMELALKSVNKRKGNLEDFEALMKIDEKLTQLFKGWIMHLGADVRKGKRRLPTKLMKGKKPKDRYPYMVEGMELLPLRRILDKDELPVDIPADEAENHPDSGDINDAALPEAIKQKYSGNREDAQSGLDDRQKWVAKANLLWEEWVAYMDRRLLDKAEDDGGPVNTVELIISKIEGPFPGYSDDNDVILTNWESI